MFESRGGGGWLGVEGVVVSIWPPYGVASLRVAVWGLDLGLLNGEGGLDVLSCLWAYGRCVCP